MNIAVAVHGAPFASQAARSALKFVQAAVAREHRVYRVFFYHEGVRVADTQRVVPQEDVPLLDEWVELARVHKIELTLCIAAALKRGILNDEERQRYDRQAATADPRFEIVGLGQLLDAVITADRFVTFAD